MKKNKVFSLWIVFMFVGQTLSAEAQTAPGFNSVSNVDLPLGAGGNVLMTLSAAGNVGIGTTAPAYLLDVSGTEHVSGNLIVEQNLAVGQAIASGGVISGLGIKAGNDPEACSSASAGTMRFTSSTFQGCNGTNWINMQTGFPVSHSAIILPYDSGSYCSVYTDVSGLAHLTIYTNYVISPASMYTGGYSAVVNPTLAGTFVSAMGKVTAGGVSCNAILNCSASAYGISISAAGCAGDDVAKALTYGAFKAW